MGVVLKQDGSHRVITHLSAPPGRSINDGIDPEAVTLAYTSVDEAIHLANTLGKGTLFAKIDLKSAFRQCPVRAGDWHLLGLHWRGQYYYDKCLPFGLRSSPFLFNTVAVALEYIIKMHLGNPSVIHYLDDFLFAGPPGSDECEHTLIGAESLCDHLGVETKRAKRTSPTTCITFLGIELDTVAQTARVPPAKLSLLMEELSTFRDRRKCTKRELLSLIGKLAFAAKVIPAGRIFLRRLIDASTTVPLLHHQLRVSAGIRADIDWWLEFATDWNGTAFFLDHEWLPSPQFQLHTDASQLGYGCSWQGHWLYGLWDKKQLHQDIQWKELFAVLLAATAWGAQWSRKRILIHCDNHAVVDVWRSGTTKHKALMRLIRSLFFTAAKHNFTVLLKHIPGVDNSIADSLSRSQLHRFHLLAPGADTHATPTPAVGIFHWCSDCTACKLWGLRHPRDALIAQESDIMCFSVSCTASHHGRPRRQPWGTTACMRTGPSPMAPSWCTWRGCVTATWNVATLTPQLTSLCWPTSAEGSGDTRAPAAAELRGNRYLPNSC